MVYCQKCGNQLTEDSKFCDKCGQQATTHVENSEQIVNSDSLNQAKEEPVSKSKDLKGLGGWLILVILGLLYVGYSYGAMALAGIKYFNDGTVEQLSIIPGYSGALGFEVAMQILLFLFVVYLIFLFFKKDKKFPKLFIIFAVINIIFILIDTSILASLSFPTDAIKQAMQAPIQDGYTQLGRAVIYAAIWISYVKLSERVRLTFVE